MVFTIVSYLAVNDYKNRSNKEPPAILPEYFDSQKLNLQHFGTIWSSSVPSTVQQFWAEYFDLKYLHEG